MTFETIKEILQPPRFTSEEENRTAAILRVISIVTLIGMCAILASRFFEADLVNVISMTILTVSVAASIVLGQMRYSRAANALFLWSVLAFLIYMGAHYDGINDTAILAIPGLIVAAALILGRRHFTLYTLIAILCVIGIGVAEYLGFLRNAFSSGIHIVNIVDLVVILSVTAVAIRLLANNLHRSIDRAVASERETKRQSEQLSASELRYRTLFESANYAIFLMVDGRFIECNSMAMRMFGCEVASDIIDHYPWEFSPMRQPDGAESGTKAKAVIDAALAGIPQRFYWKHSRKDGSEFDAEVSLKAFDLGSEKVIQAMVADITERMKAEEALRRSEETFYKIFHASPVPMSISKLETGEYVDANESFLHHTEFEREELIGRTAVDLKTWGEPEKRKDFATTLLRERSIHNFEGQYRTKSGKIGYSILSAEVIDLNGEPHALGVSVDITDRKRAEEALHLQISALESTANSIVITDREGTIQWANPAFSKMTGYDTIEALGQNPRVLKSGTHTNEFYSSLWKTILGGEVWHGEIVNRRKDGTVYDEEMTITPVRSADGKIRNFVAVKQEITERKKAEEVLKRYELISEYARDAILLVEAKSGRILEANKAAERMYGYTREELLLLNLRDLRIAETVHTLAAEMKEADEKGIFLETTHCHKDGTTFPVEVSARGALIGGSRLLISIIRDVTDRKRVQDALKESDQLHRALVSASPDAITVSDRDGFVSFVSERALTLFGESQFDEFYGRRLIDRVVPEDRARAMDDIQRVITEGIHRASEYVMVRKDGKRFIAEIHREPHRDSSGHIIGYVAFVRDITERKRAEKELEEKERRYRALFDLSPGGIVLTDIGGNILEANQAATSMNGYSTDELVGKNVRMLVRPQDLQEVDRNIEQLRRGTALQHEVVNVKKDGSLCDIELRESVISLPDGKQGILSITSDISERKKSEKLLRESEARFRAIVTNSHDAVLFLDADGMIKYASPSYERISGYTIQGRPSQTPFQLVHPDDTQRVRDTFATLGKSGGIEIIEFRIVTKEGQIRWIDATGQNLLEDPNVGMIVVNIRDITERKEADEALRESEKRYRNLVDISPDAVIIHQDFKAVFANPAAATLMGMKSPAELLGRSIFEVIPEERYEVVRERYRMMTDENKVLPFTEITLQRPDGVAVDVETNTIPTAWEGKPAAQVVIHDLSERKKAEAALQESEERFRSLSRVTFEGIMIHEEGVIIDANQRFADLFGLPNPEYLIGKNGVEVLPFTPETRDRIRKALTARTDDPFEITIVRPDGSAFPAETQSHRAVYRGRFASVVTVRDVTERKKAQRALAESEERFRALVQNSSDVITVLDSNGVITYMSPSVSRILKYNAEDMIGKNAFEFIHPGDIEVVRKDFSDMVEGHPDNVPTEFRFRTPEGGWTYVESVSSDLTQTPSVNGFVLNTRDISERKKAEAALKESEERFRLLVENSTELIAELSAEGRFIYVSPNYRDILGYSPSELIQDGAFKRVHPEDLTHVLAKFKKGQASDVYRYQHKDGTWKWFETSGQRFKTSNGEERAVVISRDITARKQAEEELSRSRRRLQRFSEHLESVLDEERKRISREIHDELGQMLTVLKFDVSWFKLRSKSRSKEVSTKLKEMDSTVGQALASVKRISRELRPPQLDALGLVGAIQLDANQIERKFGIRLRLSIDPPEFQVNEQLGMTIYRVFNEALTNVVRHANAKHIEIRLRKTADSVDLLVHDDGRGISHKELQEDFSLGLVGMRERVRQWNGTLNIQGSKNKGTTIDAHFPLLGKTLEGINP